MNDEKLIQLLHQRFEYTIDNNQDLSCDVTFTLREVMEEIQAEASYKFLVSYLARATGGEVHWRR